MPFDSLPSRLGSVPSQQFPVQPAPQVYPIADIVQKGVESIDNIIKTFDPMSKIEKEAKIAHNAVILQAFEMGRNGNHQGMNDLLQYANGSFDKYGEEVKRSTINRNNSAAWKSRHGAKPAHSSNMIGLINHAREFAKGKKEPPVSPFETPETMDASASVFNPPAPAQEQTLLPPTSLE